MRELSEGMHKSGGVGLGVGGVGEWGEECLFGVDLPGSDNRV